MNFLLYRCHKNDFISKTDEDNAFVNQMLFIHSSPFPYLLFKQVSPSSECDCATSLLPEASPPGKKCVSLLNNQLSPSSESNHKKNLSLLCDCQSLPSSECDCVTSLLPEASPPGKKCVSLLNNQLSPSSESNHKKDLSLLCYQSLPSSECDSTSLLPKDSPPGKKCVSLLNNQLSP
jgi:hypothetical protein